MSDSKLIKNECNGKYFIPNAKGYECDDQLGVDVS
jgi:hypothetical protein